MPYIPPEKGDIRTPLGRRGPPRPPEHPGSTVLIVVLIVAAIATFILARNLIF